jgi:hypothetical protein
MTRASPKLDTFADHLANGLTVREAAAEMGQGVRRGDRYLVLIKRKLGVEQCK